MFRDLPEKVETKLQETVGRRRFGRRRFHPMMFEEIMFHPAVRESPDGEGAAWLMLGSMMAEDAPWVHEIAMEMYRATCSRKPDRIAAAREAARRTLKAISESRPFHHMMREEDPEMHMMARHLPEMLEQFLLRTEPQSGIEQPPPKPRRRPPEKERE